MVAMIIAVMLGLTGQESSAAENPHYQSIEVQESSCYGTCPGYTITITPDDRFVLDARRYARTQGRSEGSLTPGAFRRMVNILNRAEFEDLAVAASLPDPGPCPILLSEATFYVLIAEGPAATNMMRWRGSCRGTEMADRVIGVRQALKREYDYEQLIEPTQKQVWEFNRQWFEGREGMIDPEVLHSIDDLTNMSADEETGE
jgi:hypothetical protein